MRPVLEDGTTDSNSHRLPLSDDPSEKLHPFSRANNMLNGSLRRYSQCVKGFVSSLYPGDGRVRAQLSKRGIPIECSQVAPVTGSKALPLFAAPSTN